MNPAMVSGKQDGRPDIRAPQSEGSGEGHAPEPGDDISSAENSDQCSSSSSSSSSSAENSDECSSSSSNDEDSGGTEEQDEGRSCGAPPPKKNSVRPVEREAVEQSASGQGAPPETKPLRPPVEYFRDFFDADLVAEVAKQSNLHFARQRPSRRLDLDREELEQFIGTCIYMSVVRLPRWQMYWSGPSRVEQVADVMSRDRWEQVKRFLHFSDDASPCAAAGDALFKIRPLMDALLHKFQSLPRDRMLSVHEQMVPLSGRAHLRRRALVAPHTWAYKLLVLCDSKGLVHSFDVCAETGDPGDLGDPVPGERVAGPSENAAVLKLARVLGGSADHLLFLDECFCSVDLLVALAHRGVLALGPVPSAAGLPGCRFSADADMKKTAGAAAFEEQRAVVDGVEIRAVKWLDKKRLIVAGTLGGARPVSGAERWDAARRVKVRVDCPNMAAMYREFAGGAALEAAMSHFRIHVRSKKFYQRLFFHLVDLVVANSWALFRRDCESAPSRRTDPLWFRTSIAQALCVQGKDLRSDKRRRPRSDVDGERGEKRRRGPAGAIPAPEVRSDAAGHWPQVDGKRQRCKFPKCRGFTGIKCAKCRVHLCLNKHNNCFCAFHH